MFTKGPGMPGMELTYSPGGVFPAAHEHRAVSPTAIVGAQADICAEHSAGFAKQIFDVLPPNAVW